MRICKAILSSFCAIIIIICSIIQFHHHDETGKMVVFSCSEHFSDIVHSHEHFDFHKYNQCSHGCNDGHHQDEKNCSLKINIAKTEKKNIQQIVIACVIIADFFSDLNNNDKELFFITDTPLQSYDGFPATALRAPPTV